MHFRHILAKIQPLKSEFFIISL